MKQYQWILASILFASTTLPIHSFASTTKTQVTNQDDSKTILAHVNNQPIYKSQLNPQIKTELKKYQKLLSRKQIAPEIEAKIQHDVLQKHIDAELIHQASQKHSVDNIEEKVAQFIQKAKENGQAIQSKTAIKRQIHINEYLEAHDLIAPQPPEEEVKAFYEKGKKNFISTQDKIHVQHIFVKKDNKDNINKAKQLLTSGVSFEEVAKKYSEDENTQDKGGDLGFITKNYMPKEFEEVAFTIQQNKLSDIIETEEGFHLFKVLEIRPAGSTIPYEQMRDFLTRGLALQTKNENIEKHLKKLRNNATIKILNTQN